MSAATVIAAWASTASRTSSSTLGLAAGFGFRGKKGLGIGGRYTAGISKLGDFETASGIDPDFRNGVIQVSLYIPLTR